MQRRRFGFGGSSALNWTLGFAVVTACSVYDASLLTGGSEGQGGTSNAGEGGEGASTGGRGGTSGNQGGGTGGAGASGGSGASSGSGSGGSKGGSAGTTGGSMGGSDPTGGEGGESGTAGSAGSGAGGGGGDGPSGGSGGSGGSAGDGGGGACGKCGCGMPETDTDGDTVPDCIDMCDGLRDADCTALENGLAHRYSFGGTGTVATDSKGTRNGTILNATLTGTGSLTLTGGTTTSPPYVNLPNGMISALTNATFEVWLTWNQSGTTNQSWQRIFDFGTTGTEDFAPNASPATTGTTYLFLTCRAGQSPTVLRGAFSTAGAGAEVAVNASAALGTATQQHVALVVDDTNNSLTLYLNGLPQNALLSFTGQLSEITDVNNWLGRSQYSGDPELNASYNEFRIYNVALTAAQIATSAMAGPDAAFLD